MKQKGVGKQEQGYPMPTVPATSQTRISEGVLPLCRNYSFFLLLKQHIHIFKDHWEHYCKRSKYDWSRLQKSLQNKQKFRLLFIQENFSLTIYHYFLGSKTGNISVSTKLQVSVTPIVCSDPPHTMAHFQFRKQC